MSAYIPCPRRKGSPRIALDVCLSCRYNQQCTAFQSYRNPPLFPAKTKDRHRNQDTPPVPDLTKASA